MEGTEREGWGLLDIAEEDPGSVSTSRGWGAQVA